MIADAQEAMGEYKRKDTAAASLAFFLKNTELGLFSSSTCSNDRF